MQYNAVQGRRRCTVDFIYHVRNVVMEDLEADGIKKA